jgi:hypothetical protein
MLFECRRCCSRAGSFGRLWSRYHASYPRSAGDNKRAQSNHANTAHTARTCRADKRAQSGRASASRAGNPACPLISLQRGHLPAW